MDNETRLVFQGWLNLSTEQRKELAKAVADYERADLYGRRRMTEDLGRRVKSYLGPLGGRCGCCGR